MKAIARVTYGPPAGLQLVETAMPIVGADQVLVKVHSSSVNPYDWHISRGLPYLVRINDGLRNPKSRDVGIDLAGTVSAVGANVTAFTVDDEVFGGGIGTFAQYALANVSRIAHKPSSVSFESASTISCAGTTALQGLRDIGHLGEGQSVLINGASGGVGTFAVQIAKTMGARVTGVCSTKNLELVRSLGADEVIDYTAEEFSRRGRNFDVIFDTVGNRTLSDFRRALAPRGSLVLATGPNGRFLGPLTLMLKAMVATRFVPQDLRPVMAKITSEDLQTLSKLIESGMITPVLDRTFPLAQCGAAIAYVEQGHARGKVTVAIS